MARKRGMQFIPYDYEAAYNKAMEDMHERLMLHTDSTRALQEHTR